LKAGSGNRAVERAKRATDRAIVPVFLPPAADRGASIDPPPRAPCEDLERWTARTIAAIDSSLATRARGPRQVAFYGGSIGRLDPAMRVALLAAGLQGGLSRARRVLARGVAAPRQAAVRTGSPVVESLRVTLDPDHATPALLAELAARGVGTVELDAASFEDDALSAAGLGWRGETVASAAAAVREAGLELGLVMRPGLPSAAPGEALRSARRAAELAPDFVRVYPVLVYAGSGLEAMLAAGRYRPMALEAAVELCRELLRLFEEARVPVGRMGLQPAVDLDGGPAVVAGPHHPSLRSLAEAGLWLEKAIRVVTAHFRFQKEATLSVHPLDESRLRGPRGENLLRVREKFRLSRIDVQTDARVPRGEIRFGAIAARKAG
jgi:hypothetical protein